MFGGAGELGEDPEAQRRQRGRGRAKWNDDPDQTEIVKKILNRSSSLKNEVTENPGKD